MNQQVWLRVASRWHYIQPGTQQSSGSSQDRIASSSTALINHGLHSPAAVLLPSVSAAAAGNLTTQGLWPLPLQFPELSSVVASLRILISFPFMWNYRPRTYFYCSNINVWDLVTEYGNEYIALLWGHKVMRNYCFVCFLAIIRVPNCCYSLFPSIHKFFVLHTLFILGS